MPRVERLNALVGRYVNLCCRLPGGASVQIPDDEKTCLGSELASERGDGRCFGVLANAGFLLIFTYETEGANPELLLFRKR